MKQKRYINLSPTQKIKVDEAINKTVSRYKSIIESHEIKEEEEERIHKLLRDSQEIYFYHVSPYFYEWEFNTMTEKLINNI